MLRVLRIRRIWWILCIRSLAATGQSGGGVRGLTGKGDNRGGASDDRRTRAHGTCLLCSGEAGRTACWTSVVCFSRAATGVGHSISDLS
jgi:hypothetical protein